MVVVSHEPSPFGTLVISGVTYTGYVNLAGGGDVAAMGYFLTDAVLTPGTMVTIMTQRRSDGEIEAFIVLHGSD